MLKLNAKSWQVLDDDTNAPVCPPQPIKLGRWCLEDDGDIAPYEGQACVGAVEVVEVEGRLDVRPIAWRETVAPVRSITRREATQWIGGLDDAGIRALLVDLLLNARGRLLRDPRINRNGARR